MLVILLCFASCGSKNPWDDAIYKEDKTFGEGKATVEVELTVNENNVTFTIKTDKTTLGDALTEHGLIEGEEGAYGLYVKKVNGITADYDVDKTYWAFYKDGVALLTGVDSTDISDGEHYEIVYTK